MAAEPETLVPEGWNYFNYFTEVEEHFQRARGTSLFLMSPLDWALVESWKNSGIPLEAVLRGIDQAFVKWRARKDKLKLVNSVAYCAQAVQKESRLMANGTLAPRAPAEPPFDKEELRHFLANNAQLLRERPGFESVAHNLEELCKDAEAHLADLEQLEQRLTSLEEKMCAIVRSGLGEEDLFALRTELDASLKPYRSKMSAEQIAMLERQYLDSRIQTKAGLPRLSLFYLK
ncbi:MAG: hypothetical protein H7039_12990 [Bryobacteraceae bacterium]|nr:hypothetical protein [Bryobacteraceae bacterium]